MLLNILFSSLFYLDLSHSIIELTDNIMLANVIQSTIHSSTLILMCFSYLFLNSNEYIYQFRDYSFGFLLVDSIYFYLYLNCESKYIYLLHHFIFICGWLLFDQYDSIVYHNFMVLLLSEISNIPLNLT